MPSFRALATISSHTGPVANTPNPADWTLNDPTTSQSGTVIYAFSGACFELNGDPGITYAALPPGFTPTAATVVCIGNFGALLEIQVTGRVVSNDPADTASGYSNLGVSTTSGVSNNIGQQPIPSIDFTFPRDIVQNDFLSNFVVHLDTTNGSGNPCSATASLIRIEGDYTIVVSQFQFTLNTPTDPLPGKEITLTSDPNDPDAMPMQDVTEIHYTWNDGTDHEIIQTVFETQYPFLLIFVIPFGFGEFTGTVNIAAFVVSTEFSGSVPLGTMEILFENGSGIYRLVPGKRNDTLYSPDRDGTTVDKKIPNPFGRTGFIGG